MKKCFILVAMMFVLILTGCASSPYLVDKPFIMNPAALLDNNNSQEKSMKSLLASFTDRGWTIQKVDKENNTITAEACRQAEHCMEVLATVRSDGSVEIIRTPGQKISKDEGELLRRWMTLLNRSFVKHNR